MDGLSHPSVDGSVSTDFAEASQLDQTEISTDTAPAAVLPRRPASSFGKPSTPAPNSSRVVKRMPT